METEQVSWLAQKHPCSLCPKSFWRPSDQTRHIWIPTVKKSFTIVNNVRSHSRKPAAWWSTCLPTLEKKTISPDIGNALHFMHIMHSHSGEKLHNCGQCSKSFVRFSYLKTHMTMHTGEKSHKCSQCDIGRAGSLKVHIHQEVVISYFTFSQIYFHSGRNPIVQNQKYWPIF